MDKKGFTLVELLITIAIIGILAAIGIPSYVGMQKKARRSEAFTNLQNLALLEAQFFADNGCFYPGCPAAATTVSYTSLVTSYPNIQYQTSAQAFLPIFQPGSYAALNYNYSISVTNSATTFTATAVGKAGTSVVGDTFTIDSSNIKNF